MIVRCTTRLLDLLAPGELADLPAAPDDWYLNLIWIDRRKCLLIVHADTLFSVFVADVRKPELAKLGQYVASTVAAALADEDLPSGCLGSLDPRQARLARTASRHVLGYMNDMASTCEHFAAHAGGVLDMKVDQLSAFLRRTPYNRGGYVRPIDAARQR